MFNIIKKEALSRLAIYKANASSVEFPEDPLIKEHKATTDIFNQDKTKLKSNDTNRYFTCENCGRNISGGRFAQHINKCLERRRR